MIKRFGLNILTLALLVLIIGTGCDQALKNWVNGASTNPSVAPTPDSSVNPNVCNTITASGSVNSVHYFDAQLGTGLSYGVNQRTYWRNLVYPNSCAYDGILTNSNFTNSSGWSSDTPYRILLDGTDDYVDMGTNLNSLSSLALETWVLPTNASQSGATLLSNGDTSSKGLAIKQIGDKGILQLSLGAEKTYAEEVLADNPVVYYTLNNNSGSTAFNLISSGPNGILTSNVLTVASTSAVTDGGNSIYLNANGEINLGSGATVLNLFNASSSWTAEMWVNPASYPGGANWHWLFSKAYTSHVMPHYQIDIRMTTTGTITAAIFQNTATAGYLGVSSVTSMSIGTWNHIALTFDGPASQLKLYLNGTLVSTSGVPVGTYTNHPTVTVIGENYNLANNGTYSSRAYYDDIALYSTALSSTRVLAHYNARYNTTCQSQSSLTNNLWHHVSGVVDNASQSLKLFVNGTQECLVTSAAVTSIAGSTNNLNFGRDPSTTSNNWTGGVSDVRTYNVALSSSAIKADVVSSWNKFTDIPQTVSNLLAWYKADSLTSLSDGQAVTTWTDSSGNITNASQSVVGNKPIYKTNILNNLPVVRFDGTDDFLDIGTAIGKPANYTLFIIAKSSDITARRSVFGSCDAGGGTNLCSMFVESKAYGSAIDGATGYFLSNGAANSYGTTNSAVFSNGTFVQISSVYSSGSTFGSIFKNGVSQTVTPISSTSTTNSGASHPTSIGRPGAFPGFYWSGDIAEIIIYDRALSDTERRRIEAYLNAKYNLY